MRYTLRIDVTPNSEDDAKTLDDELRRDVLKMQRRFEALGTDVVTEIATEDGPETPGDETVTGDGEDGNDEDEKTNERKGGKK